MKTFAELRKINVSEHVEKKNNLSYLSWAWAVDQLFLADETATWEYRWWGDQPYLKIGETYMVFCTVKAFERERTAQLPIMNFRNIAMTEFTSFDLNTTMQRCLAKAISLHGIGLYIYAGEDLPPDEEKNVAEKEKVETPGQIVAKNLAIEGMPPEVVKALRDEAKRIEGDFYTISAKAALGSWSAFKKTAGQDEQKACWEFLDSKVRSGIKKYGEATREGT